MADVTPETMTNDDLVKEAAILYSLSDALQEGMTDDDVAWVRRTVAGLIGLPLQYTNADAIVERYAELMRENEARKQAKDAKKVQ